MVACQKEIQRFLARAQPEVLCISGKWGVGKTFAWKKYLLEARDLEGGIALHNYSYVSLFGLGSLDEIKRAIFENTLEKSKVGQVADLKTLEGAVRRIASAWRSGGQLARLIAPVADYAAAFEKLGFFSVRKQIVCFDDLERKSSDVEMRDVLGLISFLKEQRECKVVVLLNDEMLGDDDLEFRSQLEKVADTLVRFEPTPQEAADIGVAADVPLRDQVKKDCVTLGVVNIRTIKRICGWAERLHEQLGDLDQRVLAQAIHSATLFAYAQAQPDVAPSLEFIRQHNDFAIAVADVNNKPIAHPEWVSLLRQYDFGHIDEFDAEVLGGIERGHLDEALLRREAEKVQAALAAGDDDQAFSAAWELYHGSFADNAVEVMDAIAKAVQDRPRVVTPTNLSGSISLLKELGWEGDIPGLIAGYLAARADAGRGFWNLDENTFGERVTDPDVRAAFAMKAATFKEERDLKQELTKLGKAGGWNPSDVTFLAAQPAEDYYAVFKNLQGSDLRLALRGGLMFRNIGNADENMRTVTAATTAALERIAAESPINKRRARAYGVDLAQQDDPHQEAELEIEPLE